MKVVLISGLEVIALALLVSFWVSGSRPSEAQQDGMHNCPQPGKLAYRFGAAPTAPRPASL